MQLEYGGQRISVAAGDFVIGSDASAALRLAGDAVLPRHAVIRTMPGGNLVVQAAVRGASVRVNGALVGTDPMPLLHGDRLAIGPNEIVISDPTRGGETGMFASGAAPSGARPAPGPAAALPEPSGRLISLNDGREYQVTVIPFVLGRDATAEVVIASPDASRRHAEIINRPDGAVLVDLSANGTFVNGQRVSGRQALKALDVIRIGAEEFRYYPPVRQPPPVPAPAVVPPVGAEFRLGDTLMSIPSVKAAIQAAPPAARPLATLRVKSGVSRGERLAVRTPVVNIGRAEFNDIRLSDVSVSSSHAKLQLREGIWTLTDLGSTNGTSVDGDPVADDEVALSPGATITLGEVALSFEPQDERPRAPDRTAVLARASRPNVPSPVAGAPAASAIEPAPAPTMAPPIVSVPSKMTARRRLPSTRVLLAAAILVLLAALALLVLVF